MKPKLYQTTAFPNFNLFIFIDLAKSVLVNTFVKNKTVAQKVLLVILDGWGKGDKSKADAIANANTPFVDSLYNNYPNSELKTSGEDVGLPDGQMGNSEVGHLNIGAGRVVYQELVRINKALTDGEFEQNKQWIEIIDYCNTNNKPLHLLGLVSNGGVHSHINHLKSIISIANNAKIKEIYVHAFTDGRDTDPKSGKAFLEELDAHCKANNAKIVSICGRYFAMDRDKRWERVKKAYDLLVNGKGEKQENALSAIQNSYDKGITDEFVEPIILDKNAVIKPEDAVLFFNYRTDRGRELTLALSQMNFPDFEMKSLPLHYTTLTKYDATYQNVNVIFEKDELANTLGEVLSNNGKKQLRMAETEKYPHVTFFFSGGRELNFKNEGRLMVDSPKVATYDLQPEMSAYELTDKLLTKIESEEFDFICVNYANADMVGHTGVYSAIVSAVEAVDECAKKVVFLARSKGYSIIIIADHGNADVAINSDGSPNTAHSTNPVPCFLISNTKYQLNYGRLADIAPTILQLMEIEKPKEMTGESLLR